MTREEYDAIRARFEATRPVSKDDADMAAYMLATMEHEATGKAIPTAVEAAFNAIVSRGAGVSNEPK